MSHSQHPLDNKLLLGRYRVMRLLGEGGMGTVHLARVEGAEGFTRPVVVKRMKRDVRASEEGNRLFIREAKILSKLQHPGIVGISDFGVEDGAHIMVLEYVHGYTLAPWLEFRQRRDLPLSVDVCLFIVRRVLDALNYAHHFGTEEGKEIEIVHRDISPDNVLLSNTGYVHLLDFGIASMHGPEGQGATKSVGFRGKLCYAAPETVKSEPATPRSDQYSVAILLLELLTGEIPFASDSIAETFARMVTEIPPPASGVRDDIPDGLDAVLARALAKEPSERFESALAFSRELRRFQREDEEDVAHALREQVKQEFEMLPLELGVEPLKSREAALEKILSMAPPAALGSGGLLTIVDEPPAPAELSTAGDAGAVVAAAAAPGQKQLHGLLWGLLVVGGLIALGLGAAVAVLSQAKAGAEQVVVVGGDRMDEAAAPSGTSRTRSSDVATGPTAMPFAAPGVANPGASQVAPSVAEVPPDPAATAKLAVAVPARKPSAKKASGGEQQKLTSAVQRQSGAFQACFSKNIETARTHPKAVLHFAVPQKGGGATVRVEPAAVASTPLGACLKSAGGKVSFPPLSQPVGFRLPVRARVSRTSGAK